MNLQGVPIRVELGPRDMKQGQAVAVRRDTGEKVTVQRDRITDQLSDLLEKIHDAMFHKCVVLCLLPFRLIFCRFGVHHKYDSWNCCILCFVLQSKGRAGFTRDAVQLYGRVLLAARQEAHDSGSVLRRHSVRGRDQEDQCQVRHSILPQGSKVRGPQMMLNPQKFKQALFTKLLKSAQFYALQDREHEFMSVT